MYGVYICIAYMAATAAAAAQAARGGELPEWRSSNYLH